MICSRGLAGRGGPKKKQTPGPRGTGANSAWLCLSPLLIPQVFLTVSPLETWILQLFLLFHLHLPVLLLSSIASPPHPWHGAALDTLTLYVDVLPLPGSPPGLVPRPGSWPSAVKALRVLAPGPPGNSRFILQLPFVYFPLPTTPNTYMNVSIHTI